MAASTAELLPPAPLTGTADDLAARLPTALVGQPQWVAWLLEVRNGKPTKVPFSVVTGTHAASTDPATWADFHTAFAYAVRTGLDGIGYVFAAGGDHAGVDLDHCRDPLTGTIGLWAMRIVEALDSYTEISPSGTGLHIFVRGTLPSGRRRKGSIEAYDQGRYFTVTGWHLVGTPTTLEDRQEALAAFHARELPAPPMPVSGAAPSTVGTTLDDQALLNLAHQGARGSEFGLLWRGAWQSLLYATQSEADLALCNHLAYWTNGDASRVDALFRQSGLYRTSKWDRPSYGAKTIAEAIAGTPRGYDPTLARLGPVPAAELGYTEEEIAAGRPSTSTPAPAPPIGPSVFPTGAAPSPPTAPAPPSTPLPGGRFGYTDLGNAQRLIAEYGSRLRYCYPWKCWLWWTGVRWDKDQPERAEQCAQHVGRLIQHEAAQLTDPKAQASGYAWATASESAGHIHALLELAKSAPGVPVQPEAFDQDHWRLNVANGTLDLRTGVLSAHEPAHLMLQLAPVAYNPVATAPAWSAFLSTILPDPDVRAFVQRAVGYSLTGCAFERKILVLWGKGRNGKSTFLETVQKVLGTYALTTATSTFVGRREGVIPNDLARLKGARLVSANESQAEARMDEALLKQLTGYPDQINARFLNAEFFDFTPQFTPWLRTNHKPVIRGTDDAIWDRILLVPFLVRIAEPDVDKQLPEKLEAELSGILQWAVEGCVLWQTLGLAPPDAVLAATSQYRQDQDILNEFIEDCCDIGVNLQVSATDLYTAYIAWLGVGSKPVNQRRMGMYLEERGFDKARTKIARYWLGLDLRPLSP